MPETAKNPGKWLLAALLMLLASACSSPCRDGCVRAVRCLDNPALNLNSCQAVCDNLETALEAKKKQESFKKFSTCISGLNYADSQCKTEFSLCTQHLPRFEFEKALRKTVRDASKPK